MERGADRKYLGPGSFDLKKHYLVTAPLPRGEGLGVGPKHWGRMPAHHYPEKQIIAIHFNLFLGMKRQGVITLALSGRRTKTAEFFIYPN